MTAHEWVVVDEVSGDIIAEILRGLLEAQGIEVWLNQEGAGRAYGIQIPALGAVQLLTPEDQADRARQILDAYYTNQLDLEPVPADSGAEFRSDTVEEEQTQVESEDSDVEE